MFGRSPREPESESIDQATDECAAGDMALDTLAGILRSMAEFALEQEGTDIPTFRAAAEAWAKHVTLASPPPGLGADDAKTRKGRREWEGVRRFVREYCQSSAKRVSEVSTDLRHVIWVFIRSISQAFSEDEGVDERVRLQLVRLESLVEANATAELKREVLGTVGMLKALLEERSQRQSKQMQVLGAQVRSLGDELEFARKESETDPLTRISNRKAFDEYLARSVEVHKAFGAPMSMLIVDIDHFKVVNDSYGHVTGDDVLRQVADALVKVFLRKNDFVSRLGGDEFAIILRETGEVDARALAERVLGRIRMLHIMAPDEQPIEVTVSIGLAAIDSSDDEKTWLERADRGLYAAKERGRDCMAATP
jgi:diguanylate cyclase (GGDEF)-like protein